MSVTLHEGHTRQAVFGGGSEELCVYAEVLASYLLRIDHNNGSLDSFGGAMTTVTISLPESLKSFIDEQIATKGYGNVSEYFRTLLREAQAKEEDAKLEALLIEGSHVGRGHSAFSTVLERTEDGGRRARQEAQGAEEIVKHTIRPAARDDILRQFRCYLVKSGQAGSGEPLRGSRGQNR